MASQAKQVGPDVFCLQPLRCRHAESQAPKHAFAEDSVAIVANDAMQQAQHAC